MVHPITNESNHNDGSPNSKKKLNDKSEEAAFPAKDEDINRFEQQNRYRLMASKKMVGVFVSVWMRRELLKRYDVSGIKVCSVACGIMGFLGNKGSVSVSMSIGGTSFCFIAAHLASGEKKGDEGRRNHQVSVIFRRTCFQRLTEDGDKAHPLTILGHDRIFWFGDLNYRLYLEDNLARQLLKEQDWRALQKFDQLRRELDHGGVFQGWKEGNIEFAPTYKYSTYNCNRYSGGIPSRAGEKQRTPARELRNCSTFSQEVECLLCVSKIVDADGSVTGVFCFLQQASQELQQALHVQRLSEQMALKRLKVLPSLECQRQLNKILDDTEGYFDLEMAEFQLHKVLITAMSHMHGHDND